MKKTYIALAVLALAALVSCQENEITNGTYTRQEGEVLLRVSNGRMTKSSSVGAVERGATIALGSDESGTNFFLEETITNLNELAFAPETKGTPGYTENFHALYGGFNAAVYKANAVYEADGAFELVDEANLIYKRKYPNDIWDGTGNPDLYFFLRTPASYIDANVSDAGLTYDPSDGSISFSYTSPVTADAQQDMLFTSRPLSTAADFNNLLIKESEGLPVLFHHALTGVKFAIGNDAADLVSITNIEFTGLKTSGSCVITPILEGGKYKDNPTDYSSATAVVWTPGDATTSISQEYNSVTDYESPGEGVAEFAESFYGGGNLDNLSKDSDATAAQTFWLIPQQMSDDVKLTITYTVNDGAPVTWTVDFGSVLKKNGSFIKWEAGQLRTYTIKIDEVNVRIEDTVTAGTPDPDNHDPKGLIGSQKSAVKITNTGNTDVFIRAAIVGQWVLDKGGERLIMFGFTDEVNNLYAVESWYEDQFVNHTGEHGVFDGLAGYKNTSTDTPKNYSDDYNGWVYKDGYYYCKTSVAPGADTPTPLFTSYEIKKIPHARNSGVVLSESMYFTLEISTQAINARKSDGTLRTDWENAWAEALAIDETPDGGDGE